MSAQNAFIAAGIRLPRQQDPYLPDGADDWARERTPDEKAQMFTKHVQPAALRFPPYQYRPYPKYVNDYDAGCQALGRTQIVQDEYQHRELFALWVKEDESAALARAKERELAEKAKAAEPQQATVQDLAAAMVGALKQATAAPAPEPEPASTGNTDDLSVRNTS